jgi:hypothetical protein
MKVSLTRVWVNKAYLVFLECFYSHRTEIVNYLIFSLLFQTNLLNPFNFYVSNEHTAVKDILMFLYESQY